MKNSTSHWAVMVNLNAEHGLYRLLMALIEGRNPELGHHLKRIQKLAALFSQFKELTIKETEFLVIGAGIHDVGMLLINDYIVNKPSKLTKSEYSLVQKHVDFGFKILGSLKIDVKINEIVLYHHENYDGSGYPDGLIGKEIPFLARITRILDSFETLTDQRRYQPGVSKSKAIDILQRNSHLYDPDLLECFGKMLDSKECSNGIDIY